MSQHLPDISFGWRGSPDLREAIAEEQIQDVQGIPQVGFLFAHSRRTDLRRVSNPKFVAIATEHALEPRRVDGRFHAHPSGTGKCGVKLLRLTVLMFQPALDDLARGGIQHCNLLKASVKITAYNKHHSAPFLRALVEQSQPSLLGRKEPTTLSKSTNRDLADHNRNFHFRGNCRSDAKENLIIK
jgi:hypothetical protein